LVSSLRSAVVLVDHAAKYLLVLHGHVKRHDDRLIMTGWPLLPGTEVKTVLLPFTDETM
jgi:hypothetical protein